MLEESPCDCLLPVAPKLARQAGHHWCERGVISSYTTSVRQLGCHGYLNKAPLPRRLTDVGRLAHMIGFGRRKVAKDYEVVGSARERDIEQLVLQLRSHMLGLDQDDYRRL